MRLNEVIPTFLISLRQERDYSKHTFIQFEHHLRYFMEWYGPTNAVEEITKDTISSYREFLKHWKSLKTGEIIKKSTREEKIKVIRTLLKYCRVEGINVLAPEKIEIFKDEKPTRRALTDNELERLLHAPDVSNLEGLRDKAILEFMYSTGCRIGEIPQLKKSQVDWVSKSVTLIGKGGKVGTVVLSEVAIYWLKQYLDARTDQYPSLFSHIRNRNWFSNGFIGKRTIFDLFKRYTLKAGIDPTLSPHNLRHTFCTNLARNGATLLEVKTLARHKSIKSTLVYTHVALSEVRAVHEKTMSALLIPSA